MCGDLGDQVIAVGDFRVAAVDLPHGFNLPVHAEATLATHQDCAFADHFAEFHLHFLLVFFRRVVGQQRLVAGDPLFEKSNPLGGRAVLVVVGQTLEQIVFTIFKTGLVATVVVDQLIACRDGCQGFKCVVHMKKVKGSLVCCFVFCVV